MRKNHKLNLERDDAVAREERNLKEENRLREIKERKIECTRGSNIDNKT